MVELWLVTGSILILVKLICSHKSEHGNNQTMMNGILIERRLIIWSCFLSEFPKSASVSGILQERHGQNAIRVIARCIKY